MNCVCCNYSKSFGTEHAMQKSVAMVVYNKLNQVRKTAMPKLGSFWCAAMSQGAHDHVLIT